MTRVLALDTATQACTLTLWGAGDVRARHEIQARAHNRHILSMLHDVLEGRSLHDAVDVIACGTGPGSFTGLRVAVSVAQGLAWAQDLPVQGFCSLTAQVYSAADSGMLPDDTAVLSTIDAQIDSYMDSGVGGAMVILFPRARPLPAHPNRCPSRARSNKPSCWDPVVTMSLDSPIGLAAEREWSEM